MCRWSTSTFENKQNLFNVWNVSMVDIHLRIKKKKKNVEYVDGRHPASKIPVAVLPWVAGGQSSGAV